MKARSLILFTLLSQVAVGIFITITFLQISYTLQPVEFKHISTSIYNLSIILLLISFLLMTISLGFSLTHLGSPRRAWRAMQNLKHSWLSREIVFGMLFTGFEGLVISAYLFPSTLTFTLLTSLVSGLLCGLMFIYAMAHVYMQRTIPNWNSNRTLLSFYWTAGSTGMLVTAVGLSWVPAHQDPWLRSAMLVLALGAAVVIAFQFINQSLAGLRAKPENPLRPGQRRVGTIPDRFKPWNTRLLLLAGLAALLSAWLIDYTGLLLLLALSLDLLGELSTRAAFYTSHYRSGL